MNKDALLVLHMVSQGCMLKLTEPDLLVDVGYAEMWLDRGMMFYCELGVQETGRQHVLRFHHFEPLSNQVLFYAKDGTLLAGLAAYREWPDVDAAGMQMVWQEWLKDEAALASCRMVAQEWRHAPLS
jgi:hypothetical protein